MNNRIVSKINGTKEGYISPKDIEDGNSLGVIFILNSEGEYVGFVYHDVQNDLWCVELVDECDEYDTFDEIFDRLTEEEYTIIFVD